METSPHSPINNIEISQQGVLNLLTGHESHKSPSPAILRLSYTTNEIASVLTHLFQQSFSSGALPHAWKHTYVTPIFSKADPKNYHLVLLTSKILEHILASQIMRHLESNNILSEVQYGFRSCLSCKAQLLLQMTWLPQLTINCK